MKTKIGIGIIAISIIVVVYFSLNFNADTNDELIDDVTGIQEIPVPDSIFKILVPSDKLTIDADTKTITYRQANFELKSELTELYEEIGNFNNEQNVVVIYPTFTESAYSENGFYDYYEEKCDSTCLSVPIKNNFDGEYGSSRAGYQSLKLLNYPILTDIDVDKNPDLLNNYEKIILLHNEYVTKKMFDAITAHSNVIYLYPNALYAEVESDYQKNTIRLIQGHGFPDSSIDNGFNWEHDNTRPFEFDNACNEWEFQEIDNGFMLNCYPEYVIFKNVDLLKKIKSLSK